jgi:hypothetical protein
VLLIYFAALVTGRYRQERADGALLEKPAASSAR